MPRLEADKSAVGAINRPLRICMLLFKIYRERMRGNIYTIAL